MSDHGIITEAGTVRFERLLPGPIERVWAHLTESDKRGRWLASGPMEQWTGGRVELHFKNADLSPEPEPVPDAYRKYDEGASLTGQVTRCEPPRLLSHTWGEDSEVTFELTPQGEKVLLVLTHRRLGATLMLMVASGWHTHLDILVDHLGGEVPQPFWATYTRREAEYRQRIAAT